MKKNITEKQIHDLAFRLLKRASIELPPHYVDLINAAYEKETNAIARVNLKTILDADRVAREQGRPICQDTGCVFYHVLIGRRVEYEGDLYRALHQATAKATKEVPLRPNVVHPINRKNLGDNCGWGFPYVHYDILEEADYIEISAIPYGGGGAGQTAFVEIPRIGPRIEPLMKGILETIAKAKSACPPLVVGVCIGGFKDLAVKTATLAVFRWPTGMHHPDPEIMQMEVELMRAANRLNIGPGALGGDTTVLAVHVEIRGCHTAAIPCAVAFNCWPQRIGTARLYADGRVEDITHPSYPK